MRAVERIQSSSRQEEGQEKHQSLQFASNQVLSSLETEAERAVQCGVDYLLRLSVEQNKALKISTFSRSSCVVGVVKRVLETSPCSVALPVLCAKSSPQNEGMFMVEDLNGFSGDEGNYSENERNGDQMKINTVVTEPRTVATCIEDHELKALIASEKGDIDVLLIGSDCVMSDNGMATAIVNKIGTAALAHAAKNRCQVLCCADRLKLWDDIFPPPLEKDLFELIPIDHIDKLLMPI
jgi:translation initiation factor 2B subunit (eIF-2B alpha/beta/delta family)